MYELFYTNQFLRDLKRIRKRSKSDLDALEVFIEEILVLKGIVGIPAQYKAHKLSGNYSGFYECHVKNDLLIIWLEQTAPNKLTLVRAGSHSDLF